MDPIIVVGAGISGVACARVLAEAGLPVTVVDRGRRIGGRMASRRLAERPVDTGAQYFTVTDDRFARVVADLESAGVVRPWTDTFTVLSSGAAPAPKQGPVRWGTPAGMRSVVEALASGLEVREDAVEVVTADPEGLRVDGTPASAVVLAMPDGQAARLLGEGLSPLAADLSREWEPVLALTAWWPTRLWDLDGAFVAGAFVNDDPDLAWIADDGSRRGDGAPVLVAHSTPTFAAPHVPDPQAALPAMVAAVQRVLGISVPPSGTHLQRWSMARPTGSRDEPFLLTPSGLGVCGDGWGPVSKVEGAFLSGAALGDALVTRLETEAQERRDAQIRADLARARAADQGEEHAFVRQLGFEELLED
ncbi:FAD-dependent oxidoreductase [Nocardioides psychrotolerans]|uniref:NAD(P)/FAD-dependent oxidoreductase n=1 Tax=Nocardioides psychrotolerans TaxID=1005945 RepID=UPI003137C7E9